MRKRVYISGPIAGMRDGNRQAFAQAQYKLHLDGYEALNPHDISIGYALWADCMRSDIAALVTCDAIYLLPGWTRSRGALLELQIACAIGLDVIRGD